MRRKLYSSTTLHAKPPTHYAFAVSEKLRAVDRQFRFGGGVNYRELPLHARTERAWLNLGAGGGPSMG